MDIITRRRAGLKLAQQKEEQELGAALEELGAAANRVLAEIRDVGQAVRDLNEQLEQAHEAVVTAGHNSGLN